MRLSAADLRKRLSETVLEMANLVRRVVLTSSSGGQWGIEGYETEDGIEGDEDEPVDVFQGLYIYARPGADDNAEAVMLSVGAKSNNPVIAAVRNEDARRRYVEEHGDLAAGECAIFNTLGTIRIHLTAAGECHIEAVNGNAVELALKSDVQAIKDAIADATPVANDGGAALQTDIGTSLAGIPVGTTVLKGE